MYCPECGQLLPDDAARCTACECSIDMPLQQPGESWDHWKDRVERWVVNAEHDDQQDWLPRVYALAPGARTLFKRNPDYRGQDHASVTVLLAAKARRDRAYVTVMKADHRSPPEERLSDRAKRAVAVAIDVHWSMLVGDDWLQKTPVDLVGWSMTYELVRESSKDGNATYDEVRRAVERRSVRLAAGISSPDPPRRRGHFNRFRGRGR